ncbi:cation diffusion facilitator family transporter [Ramlibacter rhizophilus]|uniref:Cation transporter n=1 Tax=Ramlibacter rhizophilus TaxID=1781167 RepID=A0A4Z0C1P5_9BURK|nr:cation diffusion facilitator family transporter [Ramlibacter rhizophilus]TFZ04734.1 cation transporter [Ramlibacter rhizophilus]
MGHDHTGHWHGHAHDHARGATSTRLAIVLALTCTVMVAELIGALVSGSLALLSDAAHMFTDAAALAIALSATRLAQRPADPRRSFGYHRFEVLAAALNAVLLLLASAYILFEAVTRAIDPPPVESATMLGVAVLGLLTNLAGMWILHAGRNDNLNLRGAYLEVWSDMLGSVGVIVAALLIGATGWLWLDPLVAALIGLWVLPRSWQLLRASTHVLLEGTPEHIEMDEVEQALLREPGVSGVHELHVWSLGTAAVSLSVHVVMAEGTAHESLLARLSALLASRFHIHHSTIQLERTACAQANEPHCFDARGHGSVHSH